MLTKKGIFLESYGEEHQIHASNSFLILGMTTELGYDSQFAIYIFSSICLNWSDTSSLLFVKSGQ